MRFATRAIRATLVGVVMGGALLSASPASADLYTCRPYSGRVLNPYGQPISGASVGLDASYPPCPNQQASPPTANTNASGQYTIYANTNATDVQVIVDVSSDGYISTTQLVAWASSAQNDISLLWAINGQVNPTAVQSGKTISFTARTKAPPSSSNPGTKVIVQIACLSQAPCGGMGPATLAPVQGTTDSAGYTSWLATLTSPAVDSIADAEICAVDSSFTGNCDSARSTPAAGKPNLVSDIYSANFWVDNAPPYVVDTVPFAPFSNPSQLSWVGVDWFDRPLVNPTTAGSGLDGASIHMQLDGVAQSIIIDPYSAPPFTRVEFNASHVSPGIHRIDTQAKDKAGNPASYSFDFNLTMVSDAPLGAGPLQAHLKAKQVAVQTAQTTPVVFHAPPIDIDPFTETWNASARAGSGQVDLPFALGQVAVIFSYPNNVPVGPSAPQYATAPAGTAGHPMAVLAPNPGTLEAHIPAGSGTLAGDISVPIPAGYNGPGAVATLQPANALLGAPQPHGGSLYLTASLAGTTQTISGVITTCQQAAPTGGISNYCQADQNPQLQATNPVNGTQPVATPVAPSNSIDPDTDTTPPVCIAAAGRQGCASQILGGGPGADYSAGSASAVFGCPVYQPVGQIAAFNLCTLDGTPATRHGYLGAYLNDWVFQDASAGGGFPLWQQDHAEADSTGDRCANGGNGSTKATVERAVAAGRALDGATSPLVGGTFRQHPSSGANALTVDVGADTQATQASSDASGPVDNPNTGLGYQLGAGPGYAVSGFSSGGSASSAGYNQVALGLLDAQGNIQADPTASSSVNSWQADSTGQGAGFGGRVQVVSGTDFTHPAVAGGYALASSFFVRFTADFSACTGGT